MKFAIITHAVHKIKENKFYAYEPYVREMNLWIKYVDEVQIVAPVSDEEITTIESKYQFQRNETERHSAPDAESHDLKTNEQMLNQVQHDESERHSEQSEAILYKEQIATSPIPRNDESERHSQLDWESHYLKTDEQILKQVQHDESEHHSEQREAISSKERIATSPTSRNDRLIKIPSFDVTSFNNGIAAIFKIPVVCFKIYKAMKWADHIHLRCPGNIGLLGCFVQILFPNKPKTIKYAGNWDPKSKQPLSYRIQKWILSNTFLTKNAKVLVYGEWPNQTKNIIPFFTASYSEKEIEQEEQIATSQTPRNDETERHSALVAESHDLKTDEQMLKQVQHDESERHSEQREAILFNEQIATSHTPRNDEIERHPELVSGSHPNALNFIFVGALSKGKQPLLSLQVIHQLKEKGYAAQLNVYGEGSERSKLEAYIYNNSLKKEVILHGNVSKEIVKKAYQKSHFLLFISKSEGWPKVVAEAMFWGCLPISSNVSCIPFMLGNGRRGTVIDSDVKMIITVIEGYLKGDEKYRKQVKEAMKWSKQYTLERFEKEIEKLL